jgi:hypothetical protein
MEKSGCFGAIVLFYMRKLSRACVVLLGILPWVGLILESPAQEKPNMVAQTLCPDERVWTGKIQNYSFGFTFIVPNGLKAYWNSARCSKDPAGGCVCMSDDGRVIPLGTKDDKVDRQAEMYADNGAELDKLTLSEAVKEHLEMLRGDGTKMSVAHNIASSLGGIPARRVVVKYVDKKTGRAMVEEFVLCLRKKEAISYSPYLRTPAEDYATDKPVFDAMIRSFKLRRRIW